MSKPDRWMPLYIGDYLADTMHLDAQQHGAYLLLIMHYWRSGPLPDDDRVLAAIARVERRAWDSDVGPSVRQFFQVSDGRLHHKRIDAEIAAANDLSDKRRAAANARYKRQSGDATGPQGGSNGHAIADAHAEQLEPHARTCPSASPSPSPRTERKVPTSSAQASPALGEETAIDRLWREGVPALKRMTGQPDRAVRALLGVLRKGNRDDCAKTLALIREAEERRLADPVAWLVAASKPRPSASERLAESYRRTLEIVGLTGDEPGRLELLQ